MICYRFDQFDTAAQLVLKLASVACANGEVFTLHLLNYMIQEDSSTMGAFAFLSTISADDRENSESPAPDGERGLSRDTEEDEDDTIGFESEKRDTIHSGASRSELLEVYWADPDCHICLPF